jgi:2,4-diaminopentanoate dehydrogenase
MRTAPLRVAVWSTGGIGSIAIRAIHRRPDLELVGVWVHTPEKIGKDAGVLANGEPIGLATTGDADALIDLRPDCIVYAASGPQGDVAAVPDYVRFLQAGINVVSTTSTRAIYPPVYDPAFRNPLAEAAKAGGASFYVSGIEPGFALDQLPLVLATQSSSIRKVHAYELGLYDDYPVASVMMDGMGFGRPMDFVPYIATPGIVLWGGQIRLVADALGVEIQQLRQTVDRFPTDRTLKVACGTLEAGSCGAVRIQCIGVVDGRDAIIIEHVTRMGRDVAPHWPIGDRDITYRIEIEGEPNLRCDMSLGLDDPARAGIRGMEAGAGAMVATAMRVVNAIPHVVAADPGLLSSLDLPLTLPRHAFDASA